MIRALGSALFALLIFCHGPSGIEAGEEIVPRIKPAAGAECRGTCKPPAKRRVYVLHSGLHTILSEPWKNIAAETLRLGLRKRGICDQDIIVLDNPFPTASWKSLFPYAGVTMFFESMEPSSKFSQESYVRLHRALQARDVSSEDELVWIGHSAGGQLGLTLATIARTIENYPDLAKEACGYHFDMVVTLGTPVGPIQLPAEVKLRHYYSPEDRIVRWVAKYHVLAYPLGAKGRISRVPSELAPSSKVRIFGEVEHPSWDMEGRVLDRILGELQSEYRPAWHCQAAVPRAGFGLCQLLCHAVDEECHVSLEDPPRK